MKKRAGFRLSPSNGKNGSMPMAKANVPPHDPREPQRALYFPALERTTAPPHVRCRLAPSRGPGFTDEMACVLRERLRLAILVMLGAFLAHFLRNALELGPAFDRRTLWLCLGGGEITVMLIGSALLWSRLPLSMRDLRTLEVILFGSIAVFFGWLQITGFHDGAVQRAIVPGHEGLIYRLVGVSAALRWFILIVLYGAFIPNTWRRCAAMVGIFAVLPILLMAVGSQVDPATAPYVLSALPEVVLLMAMAAAIAVFGSHKMRELQEKAHEAERIGQYRLKQILGIGGMGTVYLAEHVLLRRPCALKLIRAEQAGDPRTLIRFEREVRATATLTHCNTIEIFDYGHADDGTFYYVMEYLPGMNLEDLVEQHGAMPPERAIYLLRQVCQALREAHAIGLIHRDVKPSNIFASERGKVYDVAKLLDFGLVKSLDSGKEFIKVTRVGSFTGSPAFMSPEQAQGQSNLDPRTDIYNVGAVAYYLITGKLPFDRESTVQMLHAHAYEPLVPTDDFKDKVPADVQRVILRCLEKDPEHRYPDAASLEKALVGCASASGWTPEKAEEWWREHGNGAAPPAAPEARQREQETLLAGP
jgi:serine/threonine-protein kinase